jgi:hypothetical protein
LLSLVILAAALATAAAQDSKVKIFFYDKRDLPQDKSKLIKNPSIRPGVEQPFFIWVHDDRPTPSEVVVEVRAGGVPVKELVRKVTAPAKGDYVAVPLGEPPTPEPPIPGKPREFKALKPPVQIVALDMKDPKNPVVLDQEEFRLADPSTYLGVVTDNAYDPQTRTLTIRVTAKDAFVGPECRVDLVLDSQRIPCLVPGQAREGMYGGSLRGPGDELILVARNLQFNDNPDRNGLVYLTVDGYERAFTFYTTFAAEGGKRTPTEARDIILRLNAPPASQPVEKCKVGLEVDNAPANAIVELGLDRNDDGQFVGKQNELRQLIGNREQKFSFSVAGPDNSLLLKADARDWLLELNTTAIFGTRKLRLRVLSPANPDQALRVRDSQAPPGDRSWQATASEEKYWKTQIDGLIIFDAAKPAALKFVDFPAKLLRGGPLPVRATASASSGIKKVVFYAGAPDKEGKPPATAIPVEGKQLPAADGKTVVWAAELNVPTDKKGTLEVSAQFTSGADLTATQTVKIQLEDPPTDAGIEGTVTEGGRGQPNVPVQLIDAQGAVKNTTTTDAKGKYTFTKVAPGTYRIVGTKTSSFTRGEATAQVQAGDKKKDVDVKLSR